MDALRAQLAALIVQLQAAVAKLQIQLNKTMPPLSQRIYTEADASLGKRMTLNPVVPASVGCMEAVSAVLALVGISDGPQGISGTASGYEWFKNSPLFKEVSGQLLQEGDIVMNYTGSGNGSIEGHVSICGQYDKTYPGDWGLMSNESSSGLFHEQWNWSRWRAYYEVAGGMPTHIFRAI